MRILVTIGIFFLVVACRKSRPEFDGINCSGNCYILTGKVVDTPSNSGLAHVQLKFYYKPPYRFLGKQTHYLGKATTNAAGEFKFQFDGTKYKTGDGYYTIHATKSGYVYDPFNQNEVKIFHLDSSRFNLPLRQDFALFRPARLAVRFHAATVTNFEFLTFTYHYGPTGTGIILNGRRAIDTTISFQSAGDIRTFVEWHTSGNGVNIGKNDTLFTSRGGTIPYQVDL